MKYRNNTIPPYVYHIVFSYQKHGDLFYDKSENSKRQRVRLTEHESWFTCSEQIIRRLAYTLENTILTHNSVKSVLQNHP